MGKFTKVIWQIVGQVLWQYGFGNIYYVVLFHFLTHLCGREKRIKCILNKHADLNSSCTDLLHNYECAHTIPDVFKRV